MEKRGLGRGLEALIPDRAGIANTNILESKIQQGITNLPVDKIKANKNQPRLGFDKNSINELAASIREKGFIQPVVVRARHGEYELIAGERRFRAAQVLNLKEVPAIIKDVSDLDSLELSLIENVQREDLNPIDQAKAYKKLIEEYNMTQENIADTIGKDRATVANIIRLLKLPDKIQEYVSRGTISMGHARAILGLSKESEQLRLSNRIIKNDLSVRDTERYAKKIELPVQKIAKHTDPNLEALEDELSKRLGTKTRIIKSKKGGKIEIDFYSDKDLERIVSLLKSKS